MLPLQLVVKWVLSHLKNRWAGGAKCGRWFFQEALCGVVFNFVVFVLMQG